MKVLWITNVPIAKHRQMLNLSFNQSGGWLEASYSALKCNAFITLGVATIYKGDSIMKENDNSHCFYLVPCREGISKYDDSLVYNQMRWKEVIDDFKPDIIQLWGTEYSHGLCALKVSKNLPSVVFIQGMMSQIANHTFANISFSDRLKSTSIRDVVKKGTFWNEKQENQRKAEKEREIILRTQGVIVENKWCEDNCKIINRNLHIYRSMLPINSIFSNYKWKKEIMRPYTIFTTAGPSTIKGHHILLKALSIVIKEYPQTLLLIPGSDSYFKKGFINSIRRRSFPSYLLRIIEKYNLNSHVKYLGRLRPEQMAENMQICNVFVMPSAIENQSSTLIEAMMIGAPCIASYVGGVTHYLTHGVNGLLYRFDEPEILAAHIISLFSDNQLAEELSEKAYLSTTKDRLHIDLEKDYMGIYNKILTENI